LVSECSLQREPNQFLKYEKEKKLTSISVKVFRKIGYTIEKVSIGPIFSVKTAKTPNLSKS